PFEMRQLQLLGDLAEVGLEVARAVERRTREAGPEDDLTRLAMAYSRTARAVRLTVMLQSKLIKDIKAEDEAGAKARAEADKAAAEQAAVRDPAYQKKARVEAIVERVATARHHGDAPVVDRILRESAERLDDEDLYGDLMDRPLSEIVARLCKDLGLDPDWAELAQEYWAVQEIESGEAGWPLASNRPREAAGGGPRAERSEERVVEGAGGWRYAPTRTSDSS
ncbi:MAG: hypothetical protein ACXWK0_15165, partial [Caulobacteraceae bacterium]